MLFLVFPSQLALNHPWHIAVNTGVIMTVSLGFLLLVIRKAHRIPKAALPILALLFLLLVASICSSYLNDWGRPLVAYGAFISLTVISIIFLGRLSNPIYFVRILILGTVITSLVLVVASLTNEPISFYRFQGIFNNPNSMGWFTAGVGALLLGALYENRLNWSKSQRIFLCTVLIVHLLLLLACNSRAALVAVIAVILVFVTLRLADSVSLTHISLRALLRLSKLITYFILICIGFYLVGLFDPIIQKFTVKAATGNISSERLDIWLTSLEYWTWFGLGSDYAEVIGRADEASGHSTYISQLTKYGLIPAILFVMILLYIWFYALYAIRDHAIVAPTLIAILTSFLVNAAFETGASTPSMWLSVLCFSALLSENRIKKKAYKIINNIHYEDRVAY